MKVEVYNIALTPDVIQLLQLSIGHLAVSIDNGSFEVEDEMVKEAMMDNLHGLHTQMDSVLNISS
jgi:hypothetical protein